MKSRISVARSPALIAMASLALLLIPASALAGTDPQVGRQSAKPHGSLVQLAGSKGCVVDRAKPTSGCATARALREPGPFMGSRAIALSPQGEHVYVASSKSDAIAIFTRNRRHGTLSQQKGVRGCISARGSRGCATAFGLDGPNSIAISPNGRSAYATSRGSSSITAFRRNKTTGALRQLPAGAGCIADLPLPRCEAGRALSGADVVTVSPDGRNVYVGSFFGNAVAVFSRNRSTGALTQPADTTGCITEAPTSGCATGLALSSPEGMAISGDGENVFVATAVSNALLILARDPSTGALTQATDGGGCIVAGPLAGCTTGSELSGANAVAVSPDDGNVYVTSLISSSVTSFTHSVPPGGLTQFSGRSGCVEWLGAAGCSPGRGLRAPEGVAVSPDGTNVYAAAYSSGAIAVLNRSGYTGAVIQKSGPKGCVAMQSIANCTPGRALGGLSSIALSPDGRFLYSTAAKNNAVDIFRRISKR